MIKRANHVETGKEHTNMTPDLKEHPSQGEI